MAESRPDITASLAPLFEPQSVAVIGASRTEGKQGNVVMKYLLAGGYAGKVYPVNPSGGEIEGLASYPSIADVPGPVDCALVVIPAGPATDAVEQCAEAGVRAVIVGANDFAEIATEEGRERQRRLTEAARRSGMRLLGPNTNGIWNASARFSLGYNASHGDPLIDGPVSIAAHSGALFNSIAPRLRAAGVQLSKFVPVGNEADIDLLDCLEYFIADAPTKVIGLIVEGLADGARFRALAAQAAAAGKAVVALKLGTSRAGAGAALAHSSRLAGSARAYAALFRDSGVPMVSTIEGLAAACAMLAGGVEAIAGKDHAMVCVTTSGGGGSLLADFAASHGIPLAGTPDGAWEGSAAETIAGFEDVGMIRNPIDGGNLHGWAKLDEILRALESDGLVGSVACYAHMLPQLALDEQLLDAMVDRRARTGSPATVVAPGGLRPEIAARYQEESIPLFADMAACFEGLRCYYEVLRERGRAPVADESPRARLDGTLHRLLETAAPGAALSEADSAAILGQAGVPVAAHRVVEHIDQAESAADALGYPVVLKALAPGVAHKAKLGLIVTGVANADELTKAFGELDVRLSENGFDPDLVPRLVQSMVKAELELIAGISYEPPLGHFLIVGFGGVHTEVFDDVILMPIPASRTVIEHRLADSRLGDLLAAMDAITPTADILVALQDVAVAAPELVESVDVNPVLVTPSGCVAVDALVVRRAG